MANKTIIETYDDLTGDKINMDIVSDPTITFMVDGVEYEIDLGAKNRDKFYALVEPYTKVARKVGGRRGSRRTGKAAAGRSSIPREQLGAMREWAKKNGYKISERGRISQEVQDAFHAAKGK
ncbi:histone-like nucleoid-structuring protein Lsr2 [Nocardia transvalensis]|uniref:histone-like nucleoid-structuring protein Lsr2 n=1 Tax=Nocardia transvalensis TaxID=37333 RepID=UPI001894A951|nr:Lsr2 family protein [Nocardia transvalensis]MBF6330884.1 Lsr2 family protein [Nocardia transvalensis]